LTLGSLFDGIGATAKKKGDYGMAKYFSAESSKHHSLEFRPVSFFPNEYLISNSGLVWSIRRNKQVKGKLTNAGYLRVGLSVGGKRKDITIHRLVAETFIPNPKNKPTVNHLNEIKTDNRLENLQWATTLEQNIHGTRIKRAMANTDWQARNAKINHKEIARKRDYVKMQRNLMKPILQLDLEGNILAKYDGISIAARTLGIHHSKISACANGNRKTSHGYKWIFA